MTEEELINNAKEYLKAITKKPKDEYGISTKEAGRAVGWALSHQWINAKDKLPEKSKYVLIRMSSPYGASLLAVAYYLDGYFWNANNDDTMLDVTHWMPIPQIPE